MDDSTKLRAAPVTQDDPTGRVWTWQEGEYTVVRSSARSAPGCHDNCGVLLYVKDGKVAKIEGDSDSPYSQGRLCPRCLVLTEMLYSPDRIKYPMKRAREDRGKDKWERITWDEAYDLIEEKLKAIIAEFGEESIYITHGTGRDVNGYSSFLARAIGTPNNNGGFLSGLACYAPRIFSSVHKVGGLFICDYSQFWADRYDNPQWQPPGVILVWGNNPLPANSDGTLGHWIVECMKRGSKVITVDPKLTWIAGKSEVFLQIRPGTDCALLLALGNLLIQNGTYDKEFVELWTYGFEQYAENVAKYTPERVAEICGIPKERIIEAAQVIGAARTTVMQWGVAMDHQSNGFVTGQAASDLIALTGSFEKPGGQVFANECFGMSMTWSPPPEIWAPCADPIPHPERRIEGDYPIQRVRHVVSPDEILIAMETGKPYPIKAMIIQANNPIANMGAAPQRILPCIQNLEFNVVIDLFMTPTALACADVFLPVACYPERPGLTGHNPYQLTAIANATGQWEDTRSDQRIIYELGRRFNGHNEDLWSDEEGFYDYLLRDTGFTYNDMKERTWAYPEFTYYKYEKGLLRPDGQVGFNTSTGRYNFYCADLWNLYGQSPLAEYEEPPESLVSTPALATVYPLNLVTGARRWGYFHSEHRQSPTLRHLQPDPLVTINPKTAEKYGIQDGDWVLVENQWGSFKQKAQLHPGIREDTVSADHGWYFPERDPEDGTLYGTLESNSNCCIPMRPGKVGVGASYKTQLCRISKI